jgi:PAS domain S-box-containing protein
MADGILYLLVVLASFWLAIPRGPLLVAGVCTGYMVLGFLLSSPGNASHGMVNRAITLIILWAMALLTAARGSALIEAENRYRDLVGSVQAIVWRGDSKTFRFTYVSPQAEAILGYPVRRWIEEATFWQDCIVPEDRERVLASCAEATRTGLSHQFDYRMVAADGRIVWFRDYVTVIMDHGAPKESIGVMLDITEQKHAGQTVRYSEERYRALVEISPNAIFINCRDRIVFINDRGLRLFRAASPDQVIGRSPLEFFHPDFHEVIRERISRIMEAGVPAGLLEEQIVCLDGTVVDVEVDATNVLEAGIPAVQVVMRDITERRLAEREREALIQKLGERVKELTLLQKITQLLQDHSAPIDEIMGKVASLMPSGWQYPEICAARVVLDGVNYQSKNVPESPWVLRAEIYIADRVRGELKIAYLEERKSEFEGPFLKEERDLLTALAEQCALYLRSKDAHAALRHSETRFRESAERNRLMVDSLPVLVAYVDREHRYQENNEGYRRWFGEDPALLRGQHLQDVLGADAYKAILPKVEAALRGESVEFEAELPYAKGGGRNVHVAYIAHRDANGTVLGFYGLVQDISAKREVEEALRKSEERQRKIVSVLAEGIVLQEASGVIISCNPSAEKILGLSAEQIIGRTSLDSRWQAMHEDGSPFLGNQHPAMHTLQTGEPCTNVIMGVGRPDGELVWISINTKPLFHQDETRPYGVVSSFQDITKRKETEAALQDLFDKLELRVTERTAELQRTNAALMEEIAQRQEIEVALRRSESGLAEAQQIAHIGSWELDVRENRLRWSDEIYRIFEVDSVQFTPSYRAFLSLVHPEDRTLVHQAYTEALQSQKAYEVSHRILLPDGQIRHVLERCRTSYDADGLPIRSIGTTQDITDRTVAEERLRQSEERYRVLYEDNPSMYFTVAPAGIVLSVNRFGAAQLGYTPEELVGQSVLRVVHTDDHALASDHLRRCASSPQQVWHWEFRKVHKDGSVLWVRETARSGLSAEGHLVLFIVCEDISARKQAEAALNAAHAELEERVRLRTSELSEINKRLEAEIWEHARAKETLHRRDAILQAVSFGAKTFLLAVLWDGHLLDVLRRLGEAAAADHACVFQNSRTKDGDLRTSLQAEWVAQAIPSRLTDPRLQDVSYCEQGLTRWEEDLSRGIPIVGASADLSEAERALMSIRGQRSIALIPIFVGPDWWGIMAFGIIKDERSWQAAEIEALQVAASTFGAGIQRLRMEAQIRLYTDELEQLITQRTDRIKELESQRGQAEKMAALGQLAAGVAHEINNPIAGIKNAFLVLKDGIPRNHPYYHFVGMIEREIGRVATIVRRMYDLYRSESLSDQTIRLDTLIEDIAYLLKPKLSQRQVILQHHVGSTTSASHLVQHDLLQVMLNLVQNAIEASPEYGTVIVNVTHDRDHTVISVSDQGCGIPQDEMSHIFEPFFSGRDKRKTGGIGLGLSVSYNLVQAMGGRIDVVSELGQGTTFTVTMPRIPTPLTSAHLEEETQ